MEQNNYDDTISTSKQESIAKAVDLFFMELNAAQKEKICRPIIDYRRLAICFTAWLFPVFLASIVSNYLDALQSYQWQITIGVALITTSICLKRIIIYLILLYQKFAPERIRSSCVFEPTCSHYMLKAIEKYGVLRGVAKGIRRLLRCHYPNGGIDYP